MGDVRNYVVILTEFKFVLLHDSYVQYNTTKNSEVFNDVRSYDLSPSSKTVKLTVFSFLQRCHPITRCIKKIVDQPCYNVIFYLRRTEHKY